jgi:D-psicose/D-tagatose/L-ribulose 3-epimerase
MIWSGAFDASIPLEAIKKAGADGIEIPLFDPAAFDVAAFRKALADHGLACTVCSVNPAGKNPISDDPAARTAAEEHWTRMIGLTAEAGADMLVGPTYSPVGYLPGRRRTPDEWKRGVEFHQRLGPSLEQAGVYLAVEPLNRFETYFLNTAADAVQFVEEIGSSHVGILFDTFHANIEEKSVPAACRACGKWLKHVHTCENDRGVPGSGHVDWNGLFQALKDIGYDSWLTIESFNSGIPEIAAATAIWRDLAPAPGDIAFQGTAFLKRTWTSMGGRTHGS